MTDPAVTPAAAPEPKPEPWLAAGAYVDRAHVIAAELPDWLVRQIGTEALEEQLGMDGETRLEKSVGSATPGRVSAHFDANLLRRVVSFAAEHASGRVELSLGPDEPLVLTATWRGDSGEKQRIRLVLAPTAAEI